LQESTYSWMNGELVKWNEAKVPVLTHALNYGTESSRGSDFSRPQRGPAIFRLKDHVARMFESAKILPDEDARILPAKLRTQ